MFKDKLKIVIKEIDSLGTKSDALERCISKKLSGSLDMYNKEAVKTCEYLLSRSNCKVLRNIANEKKKGEL